MNGGLSDSACCWKHLHSLPRLICFPKRECTDENQISVSLPFLHIHSIIYHGVSPDGPFFAWRALEPPAPQLFPVLNSRSKVLAFCLFHPMCLVFCLLSWEFPSGNSAIQSIPNHPAPWSRSWHLVSGRGYGNHAPSYCCKCYSSLAGNVLSASKWLVAHPVPEYLAFCNIAGTLYTGDAPPPEVSPAASFFLGVADSTTHHPWRSSSLSQIRPSKQNPCVH